MDIRVRTGCITCRRRKIKCDEAKPSCARCRAANYICGGYSEPRRASPTYPALSEDESSSAVVVPAQGPSSELSLRQTTWRQDQLPAYHHFVTTTVVRLFRHDHLVFWRDQVAQMSYGRDVVYEALLAVGAVHRASLLSCQYESVQEASRLRVLGLRAYGNALRLLPGQLQQAASSEILGTLIVLTLLTYVECFQENPKGAFQHLWAAIQLIRRSGNNLSGDDLSNVFPIYDAMLQLDFVAQKLVPYACSSFSYSANLALEERPFWNSPDPDFPGCSRTPDRVAAERYRLIRLVSGHNKLSRVVWGNWCPPSERPSRDELLGFYSELLLWKANSPATFDRRDGLEILEALDSVPVDQLPMPPVACQLSSSEVALNIVMYNSYLGCALAMITTTEENPAARELETFRAVYQTLCITAGLLEAWKANGDSGSLYKPCDAISMGISMYLYNGAHRCFSLAWQEWTIAALRSIGREGLSNGATGANTLQIMCQLMANLQSRGESRQQLAHTAAASPLGPVRDRLIPLLLPRGDDGQVLAFYLRRGSGDPYGDEQNIQVAAKASWTQEPSGDMTSLNLHVYDSAIAGYPLVQDRPLALELFYSWRHMVEKGWHGYLTREVQEGFLQKEWMSDISHPRFTTV